MGSKETLLDGGSLLISLYEEQNPPEAIDGETKTFNFPPNQSQREVVTYRKVTKDLSISVQMPLCVHGWENAEKKQAMSLIVFDYRLTYAKREHVVKSIKTSFVFDEAVFPAKERPDEGPASPSVVAYAPFETPMAWNRTEAEVKNRTHVDAKAGASYMASAELSAGRDRDISHTQKYFTRGLADREFNVNTGKWTGVYWFLQQNDSQDDGVPSTFSVAILLKRASSANFKGTFDIRTEAGRWPDLKSHARRFFRTREDDPVNFDPQEPKKGQKWETLKEKISQDNLGLLQKDGKLTELVDIWGSDLGSFAPSKTS